MSYRCKISSACGPTITTNCVTLSVADPVIINSQLVNKELCSGSNTTFTVTGTSTQPITYQWQVSTDGGANYNAVPNTGVYSGANTATLTITGATTSLSGNLYRSLLSNTSCTVATVSNAAMLTVRQLPTVTLVASPLTSLLPGQTTTLTATPSASTGGTLTISWIKNGAAFANAGNTYVANVEAIGTYNVNIQEAFSSGLVCSNQSGPVVIAATASSKLFIFPSPNDGNFTVSYYNESGASAQRKITIFDSKGALVYNRQFSITGPYTLIPINLQSGSRGIYYVLVGDAGGNKLADGKVHVR